MVEVATLTYGLNGTAGVSTDSFASKRAPQYSVFSSPAGARSENATGQVWFRPSDGMFA